MSNQSTCLDSHLIRGNYLISAPWVVPVCQSPIRQGGIVIGEGRIIAVGATKNLQRKYVGIDVVQCRGILMPALVNAHVHLELSHLHDVPRPTETERMVDWVEKLLLFRQEQGDAVFINEHKRKMSKEQYDSGCILLADIRNNKDDSNLPASGIPEIMALHEFLGPTQNATDFAIETIQQLNDLYPVTGHAIYSTSPELLGYLKKKSRDAGSVFSIHLAESSDEYDFVVNGRGAFRKFLEKRSSWDGTFPENGFKDSGVVHYLDRLQLLDDKTLCVHCVHLEYGEIQLLAKRKSSVCVCPRSNKFLRVGKVPLQAMLENNILPAIGTDSLASNWSLDMWLEMQTLASEHPDVPASTILKMATFGGARSLNRECYGTLEPNKIARFLNIVDINLEKIDVADVLYKELISQGRPEHIRWVNSWNGK